MLLRISSNFFSSHLRVIAFALPLLITFNHAHGVALQMDQQNGWCAVLPVGFM